MLSIRSLVKVYPGPVTALQGVNLDVPTGMFGLLGPNGAGKSTLMKVVAGLLEPTSGEVDLDGIDVVREPHKLRPVLGYLPQDFGIYPNLTAVEFLDYLAAARGLPAGVARRRIEELLALVNLSEAARRAIGGYSGGMRQRLGIAQALLNDPELLIVDEPTVGLDPEERNRFRHLLTEMAGERIVILSTHIVSDVEATATHIALINRGRLIASATPEALLQRVEGRVWEWLVASDELTAVKSRHRISSTQRRSDGVRVRAVSDSQPAPSAQPATPNLEDAYLMFIATPAPGADAKAA